MLKDIKQVGVNYHSSWESTLEIELRKSLGELYFGYVRYFLGRSNYRINLTWWH